MQAPDSSLSLPQGKGLLVPTSMSNQPVSRQKRVKMNLIANQVYDQESTASMKRKYASCTNYTDVFGDMHPARRRQQLNSLQRYRRWSSRGHHHMLSLRSGGHTAIACKEIAPRRFTTDSRWNSQAPPTYGMWEQCYKFGRRVSSC